MLLITVPNDSEPVATALKLLILELSAIALNVIKMVLNLTTPTILPEIFVTFDAAPLEILISVAKEANDKP
jgi:hypothetical protein